MPPAADALILYAPLLAVVVAYVWASRGSGGIVVRRLKERVRVLEDTVREQAEENTGLRKRLSEVEGKTDLTIALVPVLAALRTHEAEASKRSESTLHVLGLIASRLGADEDVAA